MWKKEHIIDVFFREMQRIKRFLTSKDLFIFLFFLVMSTGLWGLHAMRKTYETMIQIPITYENFPPGYIQTRELPQKLRVTVSDRGNVLLNYRTARRFSPVFFNIEEPLRKEMEISTQAIESAIRKQLNASTQIIKINPDALHFTFVRLQKKTLPVKLDQHIELAQQYTLSDTIGISPYSVQVYAPENILDTMQFAYTESLILNGLTDTVQKKVKLKETKDISYSPAAVNVTVKAEPYTEKTVEVPVVVTNVPQDLILRIFPSVVNVTFQLGVSLYDKVNSSSFILTVDYRATLNEDNQKKIPVEIKKQPEKIFNVRINPRKVDYLIEEKD
ncbi:MAG: hypothetical protein LBR52_02990 [Prevotellaceae bacterium]|jgi:hypothetical protein|nr:hypothetical protein [Prevotellaceae bacterium]